MLKQRIVFWIASIILASSFISLSACLQSEGDVAFVIHLFESSSIDSEILNQIDTSERGGWRPLLNIDLNQSDLSIHEDHIISYDWGRQSIKVTSDLASQLLEDDMWPAFPYFVIAYDGNPVVGGVLMEAPAARFVAIPALYVSSVSMTDHKYVEMRLAQDAIVTVEPKFPSDNSTLVNNIYRHLEDEGLFSE